MNRRVGQIVAVVCIALFLFSLVQALSWRPTVLAVKPMPVREGSPDLIFESTGFKKNYGPHGFEIIGYAIVRNNGTEFAEGRVDLEYSIKRLAFHSVVANGTLLVSSVGLNPGESIFVELTHVKYLPKFGLFTLTCNVNPDRMVNESNYGNNEVKKLCFAFFRIWF
jgi:hypothetical protein